MAIKHAVATKIFIMPANQLNFKYLMRRNERSNPPAPIPETITLNGQTYSIADLMRRVTRSRVVNLQTGRTITRRSVARGATSYRHLVPSFTIEERRQLIQLEVAAIAEQYNLTQSQARNLRANSQRSVETYDIKQNLAQGLVDDNTRARLRAHGIELKE